MPGEDGWLGRLVSDDALIALTTAPSATIDTPWPAAFAARHRGRSYRNPTLAFESGQRARLVLANTLDEPTIVHWHGLNVDTANDGAGMTLVPPAGRYAYDFVVRARSGLYWYHPHPHGLTAGQTYRGLFGMLVVDDDDDRALRTALDLVWGRTDIPLVLQDRRRGAAYAATADDRTTAFSATSRRSTAAPPCTSTSRRACTASGSSTHRMRGPIAWASPTRPGRPFRSCSSAPTADCSPRRCAARNASSLPPSASTSCSISRNRGWATPSCWSRARSIRCTSRRPDPRARSRRRAHRRCARSPTRTAHLRSRVPQKARLRLHGPKALRAACSRSACASGSRARTTIPASLSTLPERAPIAAAQERAFRLGFAKGRWRINDRVFAMDETPIEVPRDASEVWLLRNYHTSMPHAMHLHGFQFRVLERETSPDQLAPLALDAKGRLATDLGWKDTVLVWPGESVRIAIDFRHPFPSPQTWVFHCHNLEHEDGGMMLRMKVG